MAEQRMRIYRGRVMHRVERHPGHHDEWYRSLCTKPHPVKGVRGSLPRAEGYVSEWTAENLLGYPDCTYCPPEVSEDAREEAGS